MNHVIHIHQQRMREKLAAIIDRTHKGSTYHRQLGILCPACGTRAARVVQSDIPDRRGAHIWIETTRTVSEDTP